MKALALVLALAWTGSAAAQGGGTAGATSAGAAPAAGAAQAGEDSRLSADEKAKRDEMMRPALALLAKGDGAGALEGLRPALAAYPNDLRVLRYSGQAAVLAKQYTEALELDTRALAQHPNQPWPIRLGRMQAEAELGRWSEFDADLLALRTAKKAGTDHALDGSSGFIIDEFELNGSPVQAVVYPLLAGRFHTLYRFLLAKPAEAPPQATATANPAGPCANPNFRPYIDVESDDIDQVHFAKDHPDLAAKGERSYSLDTYPKPCTQGLIRFYNDGEPSYETVRADVMGKGKPPAVNGK